MFFNMIYKTYWALAHVTYMTYIYTNILTVYMCRGSHNAQTRWENHATPEYPKCEIMRDPLGEPRSPIGHGSPKGFRIWGILRQRGYPNVFGHRARFPWENMVLPRGFAFGVFWCSVVLPTRLGVAFGRIFCYMMLCF